MRFLLTAGALLLMLAVVLSLISTTSSVELVSERREVMHVPGRSATSINVSLVGLVEVSYNSSCDLTVMLQMEGGLRQNVTGRSGSTSLVGDLERVYVINPTDSLCDAQIRVRLLRAHLPYWHLSIAALVVAVIGLALVTRWFVERTLRRNA